MEEKILVTAGQVPESSANSKPKNKIILLVAVISLVAISWIGVMDNLSSKYS